MFFQPNSVIDRNSNTIKEILITNDTVVDISYHIKSVLILLNKRNFLYYSNEQFVVSLFCNAHYVMLIACAPRNCTNNRNNE